MVIGVKELGARLKAVRAERGLTLRAIGAELGLNYSTLFRVEHGKPVEYDAGKAIEAFVAEAPKPDSAEIERLKAWVHWKSLEKDLSEDDALLVKAVGDVVSQVGTYKAEIERRRIEHHARGNELQAAIAKLRLAERKAEKLAETSVGGKITELIAERGEARDLAESLRVLARKFSDVILNLRPYCDACGFPAVVQYDSQGEGRFWLCARKDGDHDDDHYNGVEVYRIPVDVVEAL